MKCNRIQWNAMESNGMQCISMECNVMNVIEMGKKMCVTQCKIIYWIVIQFNAMLYDLMQYNAM